MATTVGQHSVAAFTSPVNGTTPIDANTVRGNDNTVRVAYVDHDADPGIHVQSSTLASRPVAGTAGRKWITEDSGVYTLWFDDGTNWHPVSSENVALSVLAGETLAKGDVVKVTGWNNGQDLPEVAKVASASDTAFAVMTAAVASGAMGYATNTGIVQDLNTGSFSVGNILYPNTSGGFTATKPTSGTYQAVGYVLRSNSSNGVIFVEFSAPRIVERSDNTASTIVLRDASGNFSAGTITAGAVTSTGLVTFASLKGTGATTVTNIINDGTMATASATTLATSSSIKTYVDSQVATVDTLAEVLANGNTTGANNIIVSAGQKIQTPTIAAADNTTAITIANSTGALTLASALADSNLATISTAGKVANSATTATSANTASAIVARDSSGNFSAGTITANLTGNISGTAPAGTLTGTTLASNVVNSSLTSVGTLSSLTVSGTISGSINGNAATATALQNARTINGVSFNGTADITVTAAAGTLSGNTLASGVTASSLTSVGTLTSLTVSGDLTVDSGTLKVDSANNRVGIDIGAQTLSYPLQVRRAGGAGSLGISVDGVGSIARVAQYFAIGDATSATTGHAFYTRDASATDNLVVVIDNNKRVGIGTASPSNALTINASGAAGVIVRSADTNFSSINIGVDPSNYTYIDSAKNGTGTARPLAFFIDGSERMRLDASGNLGLGVTPSAWSTQNSIRALQLDGGSLYAYGGDRVFLSQNVYFRNASGVDKDTYVKTAPATAYRQYNGAHLWLSAASGTAGTDITFTQAMTLDASGNLGIGLTSPGRRLSVSATIPHIQLCNSTTGTSAGDGFELAVANSDAYIIQRENAPMLFYTNDTERARITSGGSFLINKTDDNTTATGFRYGNNELALVRSAGSALIVDRTTDDGTLVVFRQDNNDEGSISVSGNTVSYNAFAGSHWSQLEDGSKPEILRGTVIEAIDELCEWPGEQNERLPKCKVSDTAGSKKVYGVFMDWDNDWTETNDMYVTAVGAFVCRISADVTVEQGDLLESNGDGTARVQADDVIRSSTIGKVTSTVQTHQYEDGTYCVPVVLYCG